MAEQEGGRPRFLEKTIFTYSISHLNQSDKVRFYYALKGRNGHSGLIHQFGLRQLAKTVLMADATNEQPLMDFLSDWGCPLERLPVLVKGPVKRLLKKSNQPFTRRNIPANKTILPQTFPPNTQREVQQAP